jgi:hypothetical protein
MAERLVAWVRFLVPASPEFSVEKWLFSVTLRQGCPREFVSLMHEG